MSEPITGARLVDQLLALGVVPGGVLVVHTAFSQVRPLEDGPAGLIAALREALGPAGTLVMPSMSDDDEVPFDRERTSCVGMGIVAETFRRWPGVLRGDNPHAFAAIGPHAAAIVAPQPLDVPHGPDSPVGRTHDLDAQVLLLGVGHDANTTIHLAEELAGVRYRIPKWLTVLQDGRPVRVHYREIDHCCQGFERLDGWLETEGRQVRGRVGHGEARLMRARDIVVTVLARLRADETVFLHQRGQCEECDAAWAGIPD